MKTLIKGKLIVAVDFDGTITEEAHMGSVMTLKKGCKEALTFLHKNGISLILWTCRSGIWLEDALTFLKQNEMLDLFSAINDQLPEAIEVFKPDIARKVGADFYIDDKNIFSSTIDWSEVCKFLLKKKLEVLSNG